MPDKQHAKTQNLNMRNLERGATPRELADEDARRAVGGLKYTFTDVMVESIVARKDDPSLLQAR